MFIRHHQVGSRLHVLNRSSCPLYDMQQVLDNKTDAKVEALFNKMMERASEQRPARRGKEGMAGVSRGGRWEPDVGASVLTTKKRKRPLEEVSAKCEGSELKQELDVAAEHKRSSSVQAPPARHAKVTWVACDECGRWRQLGMLGKERPPPNFVCSQNPDERFSQCSAPQVRLLLLPPQGQFDTFVPNTCLVLRPSRFQTLFVACSPTQELSDDEIDRQLGLLPQVHEKEGGEEAKGSDRNLPAVCGKSLEEVLNKMSLKAKLSHTEKRALHWHLANLEYGCATALQNVSFSWWDQDDSFGIEGDHVLITDGYQRLVEGLARYSEILLERSVTLIEHGPEGVHVHTKGGGEGIAADAVLVTVPLGVLKAKSIKFSPTLPDWKRAAIDRLGFGAIEKVPSLIV